MRIGMALNYAGGFKETAAELADFEKAGLDIVFVPEAYSYDAVSQLGYLAAVTRAGRARLGHHAAVLAHADADRDDRGGHRLTCPTAGSRSASARPDRR